MIKIVTISKEGKKLEISVKQAEEFVEKWQTNRQSLPSNNDRVEIAHINGKKIRVKTFGELAEYILNMVGKSCHEENETRYVVMIHGRKGYYTTDTNEKRETYTVKRLFGNEDCEVVEGSLVVFR